MSLEENLKSKRFVVTSEIQPPIGTGVQDLLRNVERAPRADTAVIFSN